VHGHTYKLEVVVEGKKRKDGMVLDFNELGKVVNATVVEVLDHRNLNEIIDNPTAENIAVWIFKKLEHKISVKSVRLWEGRGKWVEVTLEDVQK
jgi:6-pyruvoyltetrahydropterin/6-carboxytetrahydropterin synthase